MSDNIETFIDLPFIRKLAANPERTSRQIEQIFSNTLNQSENNYQAEQIENLRNLGQTNKEITRGLSELLLSNQRGYDNFSASTESISQSLENVSEGVSNAVYDLNSNIGDLSGALESVYGGQLPEGKSMIEIGKMLSFNGKRTVVALAAHGGMSSYQLGQIFHPDFVEYLNNGYSSGDVSRIQQRNLSRIYEIQKHQANLIEKKKTLDPNDEAGLHGINSMVSDYKKEVTEISQHLLSGEEINLLDFALIAKRKKIPELISDGIIDQKVLGFLMRNQKIEGNMALNISRMVVKNEEGLLKPMVELDGIMGIMQETRINRKIGNKGILQREEINNNLESIDESIVDGFDTINENLGKKLDTVKGYLSDVDDSISSGFNTANTNLIKLNDSLYEIGSFNYGIKIPKEGRKLIDLIKDFGDEGKKTVLALYAKGLLDNSAKSAFNEIFSSTLSDSIANAKDPQTVLQIQNQKKRRIEEIKSELKKLGTNNSKTSEEKRNEYRTELKSIEGSLMNQDDLQYRDIYENSLASRDINELIERGFLNDDVLELLIRNQKVEGNTSLDLARIMKIDENGIMPKLNLDGDVGRRQQLKAQTIQGNVILKQNGMIVGELRNSNEKLGIIGDQIQKTNIGIDRLNGNLEEIGGELEQLNLSIDAVNYNLENIDENLEYIGDQIVQTNEGIGIVNKNLGFIGGQLTQTNKFLFDILDVGITNNNLLEESNFLSRVSNQLLTGLNEQVRLTGDQIIEVLEGVGNIIIHGFNEGFKLLENLNNFSEGILTELYKQGKTLEHISNKMDKPLDIKANENFKHGMELLELSNSGYLSAEYLKDALKSFKKGVKLNPTHLYNLYGAGISSGNLGKYKESSMYLQKSYGIAIKDNNHALAKNIALDIAKICAKNLKMRFAKQWLDKSMLSDNNFLEPYLLKARITKILGQEEEFNILVDIVTREIMETKAELKFDANYDDVLKYVYDSVTKKVNQYINKKQEKKLIDLLPRLYAIGYKDLIKKIVKNSIFSGNPKKLLSIPSFDVKNIISENKKYFEKLYLKYVSNKLGKYDSSNLFIQAYLGYGIIDFQIIEKILNTGFGCDPDFIALRETIFLEDKQKYKNIVKTKICSIEKGASLMLWEYLRKNPHSLLNI